MILTVRLVRYPLFWFLFVGAVLFGVDAWISDRPDEIVVNDEVRTRLSNLWEAQMGEVPADNQLQSLVEHWIKEEVFYREALRLQLDKGDTIIRRRLVQKLNFIAEDIPEPNQKTLQKYYQDNQSRYQLPALYTFSQIYFPHHNIEALRVARQQLFGNERDWRELGEPGMLQETYSMRSKREIASTFGDEFAERIEGLKTGDWQGPVPSIFGLHFVRITKRQAVESASYSEIERQVLNDFLHDQRQTANNEYYQHLLESYIIVRRN
ncbi:MAG: peptidylprolyl isomerase [Pseudomonadales bacterium]